MSKVKRILVVAGEASGDQHAAHCLKKFLSDYPGHYEITAIGGAHLEKIATDFIFPLANYGVTGISEILRHLKIIRIAFKKIIQYLKKQPVDLVILVDYPGFNLRLAKMIKTRFQTPILYYISPQIWAWKAKRIHTIRQYIDHMAVVLPFEKDLYKNSDVPCSFVGHPLLEFLPQLTQTQAKKKLQLPSTNRVIALLPGSRKHEVKQLFPILLKAAELIYARFNDVQFIVPIAHTLPPDLLLSYKKSSPIPIQFISEKAPIAMIASDVVIVASGTASLECALLNKPMCIIYKATRFTYLAATQLIKVKYLGLCNLIANKMIVPELLQSDCTPEHIAEMIIRFLSNDIFKKQTVNKLIQMKISLTENTADCHLSDLIYTMIQPQATYPKVLD